MAYDKSKKAEIKAEILDRISRGESLLKILRSKGMPNRDTVYQWLLNTSKYFDKEFSDSYAYARALQADIYFDQVIEIADGGLPDYESQGEAKIRMDARKWTIAKMFPNKYGEKKQLEIKQDTKITGIDIEVIKSNEKKD